MAETYIRGKPAGNQTAGDSEYVLSINRDGSINSASVAGGAANWVDGTTGASPLTDTTSTSIIAAQGAGIRTYLTDITITNGHATVDTRVQILDGVTVRREVFCKAAGGGAAMTVMLRGSANAAWSAKAVTTGSSIDVNLSGFTGA